MRVATFNINGVRQRLPNLLAWLEETRPDVVGLQEIKVHDTDFPRVELERAGYGAIWRGQGAHHGVAILARGAAPVETRRTLPGDPADTEARYIEAAVDGVLVGCLYLPNGNPWPGPKFAYKLAWFERLIAHAAALQAAGVPAVLAGDYNVVPTDHDIYALRSWTRNALVQPEPRAAVARLLAHGWAAPLSDLPPPERPGPRAAGLRSDHLLVSRALGGRLVDGGVDREVRGREGASDHAPAWVELE